MSHSLQVELHALCVELIDKCYSEGLTVGTAESCTGGLIGAALTSVSGSSSVFLGGIIAYHNTVKMDQLGVSAETLEDVGAVSGAVAKEMALGCKSKLNVDIAISVTGVAGPGGGSPDKPVGTVWIGVASKAGVDATKHFFPNQDRSLVRQRTCLEALKAMLKRLG